MVKIKLTPEQQKHKEIGDRMQKEGLYICEYCLTEIEKTGMQIVLFVSSKPDMWGLNSKGKMFCPKPECQEKSIHEVKGKPFYFYPI